VWHFPPKQRHKGLFADYVNTWLKIKQESAGYPGWCLTPDDKLRYVRQYKEREGISLDTAMIHKNPGRKATAKLMLNSFWGRFGENLHKKHTETATSPAELFGLVSNSFHNIRAIQICSDDVLEIDCLDLHDNQIVAAFTTCWARLKLSSYLDQLKQQVLYFNTDSVVYSQKPGQADIPLGNYLDDTTNELDADDYIVNFTSAGPKNYGYKTKLGKVAAKCEGSLSMYTAPNNSTMTS